MSLSIPLFDFATVWAMRPVLLCLLTVSVGFGLQCYSYTEEQQSGKIMTSDKAVVNCTTSYCFTLKREGGQDDLDVYGCSDPTVAAYNCTSNGTTSSSTDADIYTRLTCCAADLCNNPSTSLQYLFAAVLVLILIF